MVEESRDNQVEQEEEEGPVYWALEPFLAVNHHRVVEEKVVVVISPVDPRDDKPYR